ncbi:MAG: HTTM domain-containing protein, partial [Galactobacter sp.]
MSTAQKNEPERGTSVAAGAGEAAEAARHDVGQSVQVVGVLSLVTRFGRFLASAVKALLTLLGRTTVRVYAFCENWLLDGKKAAHGLAVTRMMFGVVGIGLLATNWRTRLYTFGPGSMWNGEYVASDSDFPRIWAFSLFH